MKTRLLKRLRKEAIRKYGLSINEYGDLVVHMRSGKGTRYLKRAFEGCTLIEWTEDKDVRLPYYDGGAEAELNAIRLKYIANRAAVIRSGRQAAVLQRKSGKKHYSFG